MILFEKFAIKVPFFQILAIFWPFFAINPPF
jgi:hypothetical protein